MPTGKQQARKQASFPGPDSPFIDPERIETKGIELKPDVKLRILVTSVSTTLDFSVLVWDPKTNTHEDYPVTSVIDLDSVYPGREEEVANFLQETWADSDQPIDASLFAPQALAERIMERIEVLLENGGFEMNVYLRHPSLNDMIAIERDEAKSFAVFTP